MNTKFCSKCNQYKSFDDFGNNKSKTDGKQTYCKICRQSYMNSWYKENSMTHKERVKKVTLQYQARVRLWLYRYLQDHPCVDCGETEIILLQFDHVTDNKEFNIANAIGSGYSLARIEAEIAKCEVRCAHDHIRKTASTFHWWKLEAGGWDGDHTGLISQKIPGQYRYPPLWQQTLQSITQRG